MLEIDPTVNLYMTVGGVFAGDGQIQSLSTNRISVLMRGYLVEWQPKS